MYKYLILCIALLFIVACDDSSSGPSDTEGRQLISNTSFENSSGESDASGWTQTVPMPHNDTQFTIVDSMNTPDGDWCLETWRGIGISYAEYRLELNPGKNIITVTAWVKSTDSVYAGIVVYPLPTRFVDEMPNKNMHFLHNEWEEITYKDTVSVAPDGAAFISLYPFSTGRVGSAWFDNVRVYLEE